MLKIDIYGNEVFNFAWDWEKLSQRAAKHTTNRLCCFSAAEATIFTMCKTKLYALVALSLMQNFMLYAQKTKSETHI